MSAADPRVVADRYRLVEPLGQGGMGRVWKARDELLHRDVAIKELVPPGGLTEEERQEMRERTMREARAIARLSHPNVVRIFDILRTEGEPWIVMEYVASRSLQDVIAQEGPLPVRRVADIGLGMLAALRAAHRAGVVHRDVKPGNVLLGDDGRVVLTDFGLATVPGDPVVTRTGLVLGSPAYIAPERAHDGTAGPAADLWSLGATLYAAVEGQSPYARPSAIATLAALATEPPAPARRAGPLKPVLNGLLRKDPADRLPPREVDVLLRKAAGRKTRSNRSLLPGARRPSPEALPRLVRPAPIVAAAAVPSPRRPASEEPPPTVEDAPPAAEDAAVVEDAPPVVDAVPAVEDAPPAAEDGAEAAAEEPPEPTTDAGEPAAGPEQTAVEAARPAAQDESAEGPAVGAVAVGAVPPAQAVGDHEPALVRRRGRLSPASLASLVRAKDRRLWTAAAVVVLVVVAVLVTALVSTRDAERQAGRGDGGAASPGPGASAPTTPQQASPEPSEPPTSAPAAPSPTAEALKLPPGWHTYRHDSGWSVAVPRSWRVDEDGTIVYFREQTGERRVLGIDRSDNPKPDPVKDWRQQEAERGYDKPGYRRVRIEAVDYFVAAADWEYEYDGSARLHAINRGFVTSDDQAHAILWITPDRTWAENLDEFRLIARSFQPIPPGVNEE